MTNFVLEFEKYCGFDRLKNTLKEQNMFKQEFLALHNLFEKKKHKYIINDSDKNLGAAAAEKNDVIMECKRKLYDIITYLKLSIIQWELLGVVNKFVAKNECSQKEALFLSSKAKLFTVLHFYIICKMLKNPPIGRPILAGYNWILKPASIFVLTV